ncbi:MAG TPA: adenosylcobinamide-GDP ribazoletransferase [Bryobacteraceae bacterium]|nr:adenosylcobinamide-GDP ribazoletransferase [Bryobacteraceae bacterium]
MRTLLSAISFLTIIPIPRTSVKPGRAAILFPLVGAMLGAAGAALYLGAGTFLPSSIASLIVVTFWTAITGVLHEDGLADVADAMRAGRTQEKMLAILKDSRIGTFGAMAIVLSVIARWQAVEHLATARLFEAMIAAQAVPRAAIVALAWVSRPVGTGLGLAFASTLTTTTAVVAIAQGVAAALACGIRPGVTIVLGAYLVIRGAQLHFYRRIGGVNGDCLGATEQILEIFILVLFTCRNCSW